MLKPAAVIILGLLSGACYAAAPAPISKSDCTRDSIKVSGKGSAHGIPGIYVFHTSVSQRGTDPQKAGSEVAAHAAAAVKTARAAGLADSDIQSTAISIQPVYTPKAKSGAPQVYEVQRRIVLTLRHPDRYAQLVEGLIKAGINNIGHIEALPANPGAMNDEALRAAVKDARHKAALIAKTLGEKLGPALEVSESNVSGPRPLVMGAARTNSNNGYVPGRITVNESIVAKFALSVRGCPDP